MARLEIGSDMAQDMVSGRAAARVWRMSTDGPLRFEREGRDWPHREQSRFVSASSLNWHVQQMGSGPAILLVHGTGASTHSWRRLAPLLARDFAVTAIDLPGHGFTQMPSFGGLSLPAMAQALAGLLRKLAISPALTVGHSAGAAILARMCLNGDIAPHGLISVNGALLPLRGVPGQIFSPIAKMLAGSSFVSRLFARHAAEPNVVERLLADTGSRIDADGVAQYRRLAANPNHVAAALGMMANWDLRSLADDLPKLRTPLVLVIGNNDRTIPAADGLRVRDLVRDATVEYLRATGHLTHEERPHLVAEIILKRAKAEGVLGAADV
jgi:magnesium chelatase accessory protein